MFKRTLIALMTLALATNVLLWPVSYRTVPVAIRESWPEGGGSETEWLLIAKGRIGFAQSKHPWAKPAAGIAPNPRFRSKLEVIAGRPSYEWNYHARSRPDGWELWGLQVQRSTSQQSRSESLNIYVPCWLVTAVLGAALAGAALRQSRKGRHREAADRCIRCGYDLRATPGRCPECGQLATGSAASAAEERPHAPAT